MATKGQISLEALVAVAAFAAMLAILLSAAAEGAENLEAAGNETAEEIGGAAGMLADYAVEENGVEFSDEGAGNARSDIHP